MTNNRKDCKMRHENGNCTVAGGFCTSVNDPICEALHNAYECGHRHSALREQEERRWIPVTERFPNTGAVVLTFSNKDGVNIGKYVGYGAFVVRKWDINSKPSRTTHWMPMPEPPKGE